MEIGLSDKNCREPVSISTNLTQVFQKDILGTWKNLDLGMKSSQEGCIYFFRVYTHICRVLVIIIAFPIFPEKLLILFFNLYILHTPICVGFYEL